MDTVYQAISALYDNPNASEKEKASLWLGDVQKSVSFTMYINTRITELSFIETNVVIFVASLFLFLFWQISEKELLISCGIFYRSILGK